MQAFQVGGMKCDHCVRTVTEAVQSVAPGARVGVDRAAGRVSVDSAAVSYQGSLIRTHGPSRAIRVT